MHSHTAAWEVGLLPHSKRRRVYEKPEETLEIWGIAGPLKTCSPKNLELGHVWRVLSQSLSAHTYDKVALLTQAGSSIPSILLPTNIYGSGCWPLDTSLEDVRLSFYILVAIMRREPIGR